MSTALSSALSGLETSLHSCIPSDAELRHLESLLIKAHQAKIEASVAAAHQEAQAQLAAAHAAAQAQLEAQTAAAQAAAAQQISAAVSAQIESITPVTSNQQPVASGQQLASSEPAANEPISASLANPANEPISANLANEPAANEPISANLANEPVANEPISANLANQAKSVNARYANLNAGLNDRLAFVKSLFGGDDHDYQRVVAYLATLESKAECETFIREAVQPEYDWSKCPDVAERFMHLVYARFE
jgi:multidrug efflux pump subunit AcrA (membrane-fusion protein)